MAVIDRLLEGDPAIRWQVLRDLTDASPDEVAAERARVEHEGWGARLLALEGPDGLWEGGACFPAAYTGGEPRAVPMDGSRSAPAIRLARARRWEHAGQRYSTLEPWIDAASRVFRRSRHRLDLHRRRLHATSGVRAALERVGFVLHGSGSRRLARAPRPMVATSPRANLHDWSPDSPEVIRHRMFRDWLL